MVISRMVSPHAIHRGKAAGSGGLSIAGGLLHPVALAVCAQVTTAPIFTSGGLATAAARI
jgi:hypothetical protein